MLRKNRDLGIWPALGVHYAQGSCDGSFLHALSLRSCRLRLNHDSPLRLTQCFSVPYREETTLHGRQWPT
jgi:hypothetical protein